MKENQRNGKGKEYYENGNVKLEGEYLNDELNGKVKKYYENGILKFEGEYLNDNANGLCKGYHTNGNINFEIEYANDIPGYGRVYDNSGRIIYEGIHTKQRIFYFKR